MNTERGIVGGRRSMGGLTRRHETTESEAVREAVDFVRMAEEVMAAIRELHEQGGLDDVFGRLPD